MTATGRAGRARGGAGPAGGEGMNVRLLHGDCLDLLGTLPDASIDACVTDPPYNLEFMGRAWDRFDGEPVDPAFLHWFAGFVDGEGCFSVHAKPQGTFDCQFSISLRADDRPILERIHRTLGMGTLSKPTAHRDGDDNPKARYSISSKAQCVHLRDLLRAFPLRAKKANDFETWSDALTAWQHHEPGDEWTDMAAIRRTLMDSRKFVEEGIRVDPFQLWCWRWGREVMRVLKPGAHILAMGGSRTWHRLACGLEDAGFEIRDSVAYLYGSGFPKSLNLGEGLGTALKPAHEPIVLARKPFRGTVAANVLRHGTGALNIDSARITSGERPVMVRTATVVEANSMSGRSTGATANGETTDLGRWPANVVLDEIAARALDEQSGERPTGKGSGASWGKSDGVNEGWRRPAHAGYEATPDAGFGDTGGASRFFYCAKPSREERDYGCSGLRALTGGEATHRTDGSDGLNNPRAGAGRTGGGRNGHPTVKPVELMRWLVKLVTPINGTVLDPFLGSGTTGMACRYELRDFIGIERELEYLDIARCRIAAVAPLFAESPA